MCPVCKNLTAKDLETIKSKVFARVDAEELACEFSVKFEDMRYHCTECIKLPTSRFEKLTTMIDNLVEDVETARFTYQGEPDDAELAGAYSALVRELRTTIETAQDLVKPEEQVSEIVDKILNPMVRGLVHNMTDELQKLRTELINQGVDEEMAGRICKARLQSLGQKTNRQFQECVEALSRYFGIDLKRSAEMADEKIVGIPVH